MEPRLRASDAQFSALIEFMERNGDLSKPQSGPQGRLRADRLWVNLTQLLNSIGGGVARTSDKWKKVWADWKSKTKKKACTIRQHASGTGGGPAFRKTLSPLEERVVALIGETALSGQAGIQEQGLNRSSVSQVPSQQPPDIQDEESAAVDSVVEESLPLPPSPLAWSLPTTPPRASTINRAVTPQPQLAGADAGPSSMAHTPPRASTSARRTRAATSPHSTVSTPRRRLQPRSRRRQTQTQFQRAASEFAAVEMRRLQLEHEREARRIEDSREHRELLRKLIDLAQTFVEAYINRRV